MIKKFLKQNILAQWFSWHFLEMPRNILLSSKTFIFFCANYFSIIELFKTLFEPWKKNVESYEKGLEVPEYVNIWIDNFISKIIGAILRFALIIWGLLSIALSLMIILIIFFGWLLLPILLIYLLYYGFKIICLTLI